MKTLEKNEAIGVVIGILVVVVLFAGFRTMPFFGGFGSNSGADNIVDVTATGTSFDPEYAFAEAFGHNGEITRLIIQDLVEGDGRTAEEGSLVTVDYIGQLRDGTTFDNSFAKGEPITFTVGEGEVIEGWDQGVLGMKEGGQRVLVVPPSLGYGQRAVGPIPSGSTLVFAVELIDVR